MKLWTVLPVMPARPRSVPDREQLGLADPFASCDVCGDDITPTRMKSHRKTNSVCRFLADTAEVRTFWGLGYRDPYLVQNDGVPLTGPRSTAASPGAIACTSSGFVSGPPSLSPKLHRSRHQSTTSRRSARLGGAGRDLLGQVDHRNNGTERSRAPRDCSSCISRVVTLNGQVPSSGRSGEAVDEPQL